MSSHLIEQLESRRLMSAAPVAGAAVVGKVLTVSGTADSDLIVVGLTADQKSVFVQMSNASGTSTKTFKGSINAAVILGGAGDDMLIVDEGNGRFVPTLMVGGSGNDLLSGGSGGDVLVGDSGRDVVKGAVHSDAVGGVANGILNSDKDATSGGDDILMGNGGNDWLFGGRGNDVVYGGDGNDFLDGGEGSNFLSTDAGRNVVRARSATDLVFCTDQDFVMAEPGALVLS